jgi:hypothetical protein
MRTCEGCGIEFEGAPQARFHSDACRKAFSRRADPSLPVRQLRTEKIVELDEGPLGEEVDAEQLLREGLGYAKSESRTKAERDATAARILGTSGPTIPSLEVYVEEAKAGARKHHAEQSPDARDSTKELEVRIARAEAYARWRYKGFLAGEIASL